MLNKVIHIVEARFTERDFHRYWVQNFLDKSIDVVVWDVTAVMSRKVAQSISKDIACNYKNIEYFDSKRELIKSIMRLEDSVFILSFIPYNLNSNYIYRAISKNNIRYSLIREYSSIFVDLTNVHRSFISVIRKIILIKPVMNFLLIRMPLGFLRVRPANFVFTGGVKSNIKDPLITDKTEIVPIHTLDYDELLKGRFDSAVKFDYITFVDQDLPQHSDLISSSKPALVSKKKYYKELNEFFNYLECKYKVPVIVALHPRADLIKAKENFLGRSIFSLKTNALIKNTLFTIVHYSNAVNYCVLYKKPFVLITTNEIEVAHDNRTAAIRVLESFFSREVINLSSKEYLTKPLSIDFDTESYSQYMRDYIKNNNDDIEFWDVVAKTIKF